MQTITTILHAGIHPHAHLEGGATIDLTTLVVVGTALALGVLRLVQLKRAERRAEVRR